MSVFDDERRREIARMTESELRTLSETGMDIGSTREQDDDAAMADEEIWARRETAERIARRAAA